MNRRPQLKWRASDRALAAAAVIAIGGCSGGETELPRDAQTVGGMTIYIGVIPSEFVRDHSTAPGDPQALHGGTPPNRGSHHLVVALFDATTDARITDARIRAGVASHFADPVPQTMLEPMEIAGTMSYGNFFQMPGNADWKIRLEIQRPSSTAPVRVDFAYGHPGDGV